MKRLGNSRLLYLEQEKLDLSKAMGDIDGFIDNSNQVELSVEAIFVYPQAEKFLVGREVTGYPTELPEGVKMRDFPGREVFEEKINDAQDSYEALIKTAREQVDSRGGRLYRLVFSPGQFLTPMTQWTVDS